jgi:hypothetical protein
MKDDEKTTNQPLMPNLIVLDESEIEGLINIVRYGTKRQITHPPIQMLITRLADEIITRLCEGQILSTYADQENEAWVQAHFFNEQERIGRTMPLTVCNFGDNTKQPIDLSVPETVSKFFILSKHDVDGFIDIARDGVEDRIDFALTHNLIDRFAQALLGEMKRMKPAPTELDENEYFEWLTKTASTAAFVVYPLDELRL